MFQTWGKFETTDGRFDFMTRDKIRAQISKFPATNTPNMADKLPPIPEQNAPYVAAPGPYVTALPPEDETKFQDWVKANNIPFDPKDTAPDYDMRGFWKGVQAGDPRAMTGYNLNDNSIHFTDYWKTPYHKTFSAESQWATPDAPKWNRQDQLIDRNGNIVYDEQAEAAKSKK
jgi:hypothetical protein